MLQSKTVSEMTENRFRNEGNTVSKMMEKPVSEMDAETVSEMMATPFQK